MGAGSLHVLALRVECHIPHAQSLKQKRSVIRSLTDKLRARFNASVAESGYLDEWQRTEIAIAMVSNDNRYLQQQQSLIEQQLLEVRDISIIAIDQRWL